MSTEIKSLIQSLPISTHKAYGKALHEILIRLNNAVSSGGSYWTKTASDVWNDTENIGIGTKTPSRKLTVVDELMLTHENVDTHVIGFEIGNNVNFPGYGVTASGHSRYYTGLTPEDYWIESVINTSSIAFLGAGDFSTSYRMELNQILTGSRQTIDMTGAYLGLMTSSSIGNNRQNQVTLTPDTILIDVNDPIDLTNARTLYDAQGFLTHLANNFLTGESNSWELSASGLIHRIADLVANNGEFTYAATSAQWTFNTVTDFMVRQAVIGTGVKDVVATTKGTASFELLTDRGDGSPGWRVAGINEFATNTAAVLAGLFPNTVYHTAGVLKIVQ